MSRSESPPDPHPGDRGLLERCIESEFTRERDTAERAVPFATGVALLMPSLPLVSDGNYLLVERPGLEASELAEVADEIIGGLGMRHRTVVVADPDEGGRLRPSFERLGWATERDLYMVLRREPDRAADLAAAEVPYEEVRGIRRAIIGEGDRVTPQALEQLLAGDPVVPADVSDRWFAARLEGRIVSCCRLLSRAGVGQVEDVGTLPDARRWGAARAVVLAAAAASRRADHELTFIGALADDWPWRLYERLGFDRVGVICIFRRRPFARPH